MSKILVNIILFVLVTLAGTAQYVQIPLEYKIANAELIIEGEVIDSECYLTDNNEINTAHTIKVYKSFNHNTSERFISIITIGGELDNMTYTATHTLSLNKGQAGIFFLHKAVDDPSNLDRVTDTYYSVYTDEQGFLQYNKNEDDFFAFEKFNKYRNIDKTLFEKFEKEFNVKATEHFSSVWQYSRREIFEENISFKSSESETNCLDFLFEVQSPDPTNPLLVSVVVSVKATEDVHLTKPVIVAKYNTLGLGTNIFANGLITLEDIGVSADVNYESVIEDIAPDEVKIELNATSLEQPDLVVITTQYVPLIKMVISLPQPMDPGVALDQSEMQSLSKYFDFSESIEKIFDCVRIIGDFQSFACPNPCIINLGSTELGSTSTEPFAVDLMAGHEDVLVILGTCFGLTQGDSFIEFASGRDGYNSGAWVRPMDEDYISWNDGVIRVLIPSKGKVVSGQYPGNGKVRVTRIDPDDGSSSVGTSLTDIDIESCIDNVKINDDPLLTYFPNHAVLVNIGANNGEGGVDFYYDDGMEDNIPAQNAFEAALLKWSCEVGVNFVVKDESEVNASTSGRVFFEDLPLGVLARTTTSKLSCTEAGDPTDAHVTIAAVSLRFNTNPERPVNGGDPIPLEWYYSEDTDIDLEAIDMVDFQSRALHELGHAIGLLHVNDPSELMHFTDQSDPVSFNREITIDAELGADFVIEQSVLTPTIICASNSTPMTQLNLGAAECSGVNAIEELTDNNGWARVFPNPFNENLNIVLDKNVVDAQYEIYNSIGQLVYKNSFNGYRDQMVNLGQLSKGLYSLVLRADNDETIKIKIAKN